MELLQLCHSQSASAQERPQASPGRLRPWPGCLDTPSPACPPSSPKYGRDCLSSCAWCDVLSQLSSMHVKVICHGTILSVHSPGSFDSIPDNESGSLIAAGVACHQVPTGWGLVKSSIPLPQRRLGSPPHQMCRCWRLLLSSQSDCFLLRPLLMQLPSRQCVPTLLRSSP